MQTLGAPASLAQENLSICRYIEFSTRYTKMKILARLLKEGR